MVVVSWCVVGGVRACGACAMRVKSVVRAVRVIAAIVFGVSGVVDT